MIIDLYVVFAFFTALIQNLELRGGDIANNHEYPNKGISKLCLVNELLLVASSDGNVRIWKDDISRGKQKLITAFSSIHGHRPGARSVSVVVDWQQQFGYMVLFVETRSSADSEFRNPY
ncbi:regulatory-associated protein of TOR 1 isoform X3 [Helianthus annuus]|uniref:regulatory-associated protein of TOR 1 isoform X3 n=1 Tax=Helianthus annuus TaxID=4232 RepID=UPI000B8F7D46|nr:regulatory-associated protein of TOR 1 isoform X3 [Helianthus annuus]XP_035842803.1 regulatory-associated protein of TOR 1 isoform X3 [Helianthus annuus]